MFSAFEVRPQESSGRFDIQNESLHATTQAARIGIWVMSASIILFAVADWRVSGEIWDEVYLLKALQLSLLLVASWVLPKLRSEESVHNLMLLVGSVACVAAAASGFVIGDSNRVVMICLTTVWGATILIRWSWSQQLELAAVAGAALVGHFWLRDADPTVFVSPQGIAVGLALGGSCWLVDAINSRRRDILLRRKRSQEVLEQEIESSSISQRRMEEVLRHRDEQLRLITENMSDMVSRVNLMGVHEYVSPAHERVLGYVPEEMLGKSVLDFVHPDDRDRVIQAIYEGGQTGTGRVQCRCRHADGRYIWLETIGKVLCDPQGLPSGAVMSARDITPRKRAEEALQRAHEHLSHVVSASPVVLYSVPIEHGQLRAGWVSENFTQLTGYPDEDRNHGTEWWTEKVHPDDLSVLATLDAVLETDHTINEYRFRRPDGSYMWIRNEVRIIRGSTGEAVEMIGSWADISERKRAENQQREEAAVSAALARVGHELISALDSKELLQRLCAVTTEVLGCDVSYTVPWYPEDNAYAVAAIHGTTEEQSAAIRLLRLPREALTALLEELNDTRVFQVDTARAVTPWGAIPAQYGITIGLYVALCRGDEIIGVHAAGRTGSTERFTPLQERIIRGIAELASLALANLRLVQELERASRLKSDFLATMSHELRTPLSVITGYTDLILDKAFGSVVPEQQKVLKRVRKNAVELLDLINATLDMSRLESGRLPLNLTEISMPQLVDEVEMETRDVRLRGNLDFEWKVAPDLPNIVSDSMKIKVIMKNLLGNAAKFTEQGSVIISVRSLNNGIDISVADTGIGISPEVRPVIFDAFRQGDSSYTRRYGGVGLGLYIVQRLVDLLNGMLNVESEPGCGSTFSVWLPLSVKPEPIAQPQS